jgi:hypothetical protein
LNAGEKRVHTKEPCPREQGLMGNRQMGGGDSIWVQI